MILNFSNFFFWLVYNIKISWRLFMKSWSLLETSEAFISFWCTFGTLEGHIKRTIHLEHFRNSRPDVFEVSVNVWWWSSSCSDCFSVPFAWFVYVLFASEMWFISCSWRIPLVSGFQILRQAWKFNWTLWLNFPLI